MFIKNINKNNTTTLIKNKKNINTLNILILVGLVDFIKLNKKKILVFYKNKNIKIKNVSKFNKPIFINLKNLNLTKKKNSLYIISTNKGLFTNFDALKNNLGGIILYKIFLYGC